jgi:hypothetical protein
MLKDTFIQLIARYNNDTRLGEDLWKEIETNYSEDKKRVCCLS